MSTPKSILTPQQKQLLNLLAQDKKLSENFYLTGGTALAEFYLKHRVSQDLDFFNQEEFAPQSVSIFIKKTQKALDYKSFDFEQAFNRNIYQILFPKGKPLKLEFTYFPFLQIENPRKIGGVKIDSLLDIAVNKIFTIAQNPRGRDFFDIYFIYKKTGWKLEDLLKKAGTKFDWHIDPIQLGGQLMKVKTLQDDPIIKRRDSLWTTVEDFILKEAKKLKIKALNP